MDFRYYKRRNFKNDAMEDYEIRDVMGRQTHPSVEVDIALYFTDELVPFDVGSTDRNFLWCRIRNVGSIMAKHAYIHIEAPACVPGTEIQPGHWTAMKFHENPGDYTNTTSVVGHNDEVFSIIHITNGRSPIFPGSHIETRVPFVIEGEYIPDLKPRETMKYTVYADSMAPVTATLDPQALRRTYRIEDRRR